MTITAKVERITPTTAKKYLLGNSVNRKLRKTRVGMYAKQMAADTWRITGETIVFSPDGQLLQGQHRLHACAQAGVPFSTVVVRGVAPDAMTVMDSGLTRSASDALGFHGVANANSVAALSKRLIALRGGFQRDSTRMTQVTHDEILNFHDEYQDLVSAAILAARPVYNALRGTGWGTLAFLLIEADDVLADDFLARLADGAGLETGDPRLALRQLILNHTTQRRQITWDEMVANGIKAWNLWLDGKTVGHLKGWKPIQPFPLVSS